MSVFVSFSHADIEFAESLSTALIGQNVKVWRDEFRLRAGDELASGLVEAIGRCSVFVLLWSRAAAASKWVELEATLARSLEAEGRLQLIVIGVEADGRYEWPEWLPERVILDSAGEVESAVRTVVNRLARLEDAARAGRRFDPEARTHTDHVWHEQVTETGRVVGRLHVISIDRDEAYSILSQFTFASKAVGVCGGDDAEQMAQQLLGSAHRACAEGFEGEPYWVRLKGTAQATLTFDIDTPEGVTFAVDGQCFRVGDVRRGTTLFNVGALFGLTLPDG